VPAESWRKRFVADPDSRECPRDKIRSVPGGRDDFEMRPLPCFNPEGNHDRNNDRKHDPDDCEDGGHIH
jgi:hypothetical protein